MYSLPSASQRLAPLARTIMGGSPPTAPKARTGEFTPPGKSFSARALRDLDRCCGRTMKFEYKCSKANMSHSVLTLRLRSKWVQINGEHSSTCRNPQGTYG